jgi:hypothetical protein
MKKPAKITPGKSNPTKPEKPPHFPKIEILTLWSEYLKRSDDYNAFCALVRDRGKLPEFVSGSPTKFKENYEQFGDVFAKSFSVKAIAGRFPFEDESFEEKQYLNLFIQSLKNKLDREPTVKELVKLLALDLEKSPLLFWIIDIRGKTDAELRAAFMKKVSDRRKALPEISKKPQRIRFKRPTTKYFREGLEELKRYLQVYDQVVGETSIVRKEVGENGFSYEHHKPKPKSRYTIAGKQRGENNRGPYLDFQKAKRIISNVEEGLFPGEY